MTPYDTDARMAKRLMFALGITGAFVLISAIVFVGALLLTQATGGVKVAEGVPAQTRNIIGESLFIRRNSTATPVVDVRQDGTGPFMYFRASGGTPVAGFYPRGGKLVLGYGEALVTMTPTSTNTPTSTATPTATATATP